MYNSQGVVVRCDELLDTGDTRKTFRPPVAPEADAAELALEPREKFDGTLDEEPPEGR